MKTRTQISAKFLRNALSQLLGISTLSCAPVLWAQSDDFNSQSDSLWAKYDLRALGVAVNYGFVHDLTNGFAYHITTAGNPNFPQYGPGRAAAYRNQVIYTGRFSVGVDLLAWNDSIDQDFGVLWYLSGNPSPGLGTSDGYTLTYGPQDHLRVSVITAENPIEIGRVNPFHLDPTQHYRVVISSHDGGTYLAQVFYTTDLNNPLGSVITAESSYTTGYCGLVIYDGTSPSLTGADATYDNYTALVPNGGTLKATVTDLYPPPYGKAPDIYPTVSVGILDRDSTIDTSSLLLWQDGVPVPSALINVNSFLLRPDNPPAYVGPYSGASLTYSNTTRLPAGSHHTNTVAFADNNGAWQTNTWTWTSAYPYLYASNALPVGSLSMRGFDVRMVQTNGGANLDNSLTRAVQQLAIPPLIPNQIAATSIVQVLAWNTTGSPTNVPGLCSTFNEVKNIAVEALTYLELSAGVYRFHVNTDDRAGFYSGMKLEDPNGATLWEASGNTANATFDFVVEAPGLYPFRCIWEQSGGGAVLNFAAVNLNDSSETLVNDPTDPAGVVRAWYPLACKSAGSINGPFAVDSIAVNAVSLANVLCGGTGDPLNQMVTGGTFTIPLSGSARYYRLDGPRKTRLTGVSKSGTNLVITYQVL